MNQIEFHLVQNRNEDCHYDHIPFNSKGNGNLFSWAADEWEQLVQISTLRSNLVQNYCSRKFEFEFSWRKSDTVWFLIAIRCKSYAIWFLIAIRCKSYAIRCTSESILVILIRDSSPGLCCKISLREIFYWDQVFFPQLIQLDLILQLEIETVQKLSNYIYIYW